MVQPTEAMSQDKKVRQPGSHPTDNQTSQPSICSIDLPMSRCEYVGKEMPDGRVIARIIIKPLHFEGDPYDHYVGEDKDGEIIFAVKCTVGVFVEYRKPPEP